MASAQGFAVSFGGVNLGKIQRFRCALPGGQVVDVTAAGATILGSGANSRIVRQVDITAVDPITLEVEFLGNPSSLGPSDRGRRATLAASCHAFSVSGSALMTNLEFTGQIRDKVRGVAQFTFDGT
jgi:hypothetical protein